MVNIVNIVASPAPLPKTVVHSVLNYLPVASPGFFTNTISMNVFSEQILKYIAENAFINPRPYFKGKYAEHSPCQNPILDIPKCENENLMPLEKYMGCFTVLHSLSSLDSDDEYICQASVYFDINTRIVYLYAPELNPKLEFCKFSTY